MVWLYGYSNPPPQKSKGKDELDFKSTSDGDWIGFDLLYASFIIVLLLLRRRVKYYTCYLYTYISLYRINNKQIKNMARPRVYF